MTKQKILSAFGLYITYLLIGHHGPFSLHRDDKYHPHTHKKHVVNVLRKEDELIDTSEVRFLPLSN